MEVPESLRRLGKAIASHPNPVQVAYLGIDLWLDVMASGRIKTCEFKKGGGIATGDEGPEVVKIGFVVIGESIVVNFDPTLPPAEFRLAP